jgi:hypothetical protein
MQFFGFRENKRGLIARIGAAVHHPQDHDTARESPASAAADAEGPHAHRETGGEPDRPPGKGVSERLIEGAENCLGVKKLPAPVKVFRLTP